MYSGSNHTINRKLFLLTAILVIISISSIQYSYAQIDPVNTIRGFNAPTDITTNSTHFFVADSNRHKIQIFNLDGTFVREFGSQGTANGQLNIPTGIATNNTHIFIVERSGKIQIFDNAGTFVKSFGSSSSSNFNPRNDIATNGTHLIVTDTQNNMVQIFDINGNLIKTLGGFNFPSGVTTNSTHIFVSDTQNNMVQIFDNTGIHVRTIGLSGFPQGISVTSTHIFIADTNDNQILVLDHNGNLVKSFGGNGTASGQFDLPQGIATNDEHIFVADTGNNRLQIFELSSIFLSCADGKVFNSNEKCVVAKEFEFLNLNTVYVTGESLTGMLRFTNSSITDVNFTIISGAIPGITLNSNNAWNDHVLASEHVGNYTLHITARYTDDDGTTEQNYTKSFSFQVLTACPDGQSRDSNALCPASSFDQTALGEFGTTNGKFRFPDGITTNSTHFFVADRNNHRVQIFDNNGNHAKSFGSLGTENGEFTVPAGIATNSTHLYIVDRDNNRVQIFDSDGNYISQFGGYGTGNGEFDAPRGIAIINTNIFVSDTENNRIQVFDINGEFVKSFGSQGTGNGFFSAPTGITANSTHIFVSDSINDRVQVFDINGNYISQFGGFGTSDREFNFPTGITILFTYIFIADTNNHRVQIWDVNGNYIAQLGGEGATDGQFNTPTGITTNGTHLFITDTDNHRVQIFEFSSNLAFCSTSQIIFNNRCIEDTEKPVIKITDTRLNDAGTVVRINVRTPIDQINVTVTDNNPNYLGNITITPSSTADITRFKTFDVTYTAPADAAGNIPDPFTLIVVVGCMPGQRFDDVLCYTPEPFEFIGLNSIDAVGSSLNGRLEFINSDITGTFAVTGGALPDTTLNPDGTWSSQVLQSKHIGNHTIQITADYVVDGQLRQSVDEFSFEVFPCRLNQNLDSNNRCYTPSEIVFDDFGIYYTVGDTLSPVIAFDSDIPSPVFSIIGDNPFNIPLNSDGTWDQTLIVKSHIGTFHPVFKMTWFIDGAPRESTTTIKVRISDCRPGQTFDGIVCYVPQPFDFSGLMPTYKVNERLTGFLRFTDNVPATDFTITNGSLSGIELSSGGTWGNQRLTVEHVGSHTIEITGRYHFNSVARQTIQTFSFTVSCPDGQFYDGIACYIQNPVRFLDKSPSYVDPVNEIDVYFPGDTLSGVFRLADITISNSTFATTGGSLPGIALYPNGTLVDKLIPDTLNGIYTIRVAATYTINGAQRHSVDTFSLRIGCLPGESRDSNNECHIPEPFEFNGLASVYVEHDSLNGTLRFTNSSIIDANYTITSTSTNRTNIPNILDDITLNLDGTWGAEALTSDHIGNHIIRITATYTANDAKRQSVNSFSFNVIPFCDPGINRDENNACILNLITIADYNAMQAVGGSFSCQFTPPIEGVWRFTSTGLPSGLELNSGGMCSGLLTSAHIGNHTISITAIRENSPGFDDKTVTMDYPFEVITCPDGQTADSLGICYTPEAFVFLGLESTYDTGDTLDGTLVFTNNITATGFTITGGALPGITLNPDGTWNDHVLINTHLGVNTIQITARYTVDGGDRQSVQSFAFSVLPATCTDDQNQDANGVCYISEPFEFKGYNTNRPINLALTGTLEFTNSDVTPVSYIITSGAIPGITLNPNGTWAGERLTTAHVGVYTFEITATYTVNGAQRQSIQTFPLEVFPCRLDQNLDSNNRCYTPSEIVFDDFGIYYTVGDTLSPVIAFDSDIPSPVFSIVGDNPFNIPLNSDGTWVQTELGDEHVGTHTIVLKMNWFIDGALRESIATEVVVITGCPAGQSFDGDFCYIPVLFEFEGLKPTYTIGETLTGALAFIDTKPLPNFEATGFSITGGALPGITLNSDGTWGNQQLSDAHLGSHTIQITGLYLVDGSTTRHNIHTFSFTVECPTGQIYDGLTCYTPVPFNLRGQSPSYVDTVNEIDVYFPGDTLTGAFRFTAVIPDFNFTITGGTLTDITLNPDGTWGDELIPDTFDGIYTAQITATYLINGDQRQSVDTYSFRVGCLSGESRDSNNACYTPEAFEFNALASVYIENSPLNGTLRFTNSSITDANYTITSTFTSTFTNETSIAGVLDDITLNPNGTWAGQPLTSAHIGNHTIHITANYTVNTTIRQSTNSFSFNVIPFCDPGINRNSDDSCILNAITITDYNSMQAVGEPFSCQFAMPVEGVWRFANTGLPSGLELNSEGMCSGLLTSAHAGFHTISITAIRENSPGLDDKTITMDYPLNVVLCPDGQSLDSLGICYTPEAFVFLGLESTYTVGTTLEGRFLFINNVADARYTITNGSLPSITLNPNGTWNDHILNNTHRGNHTIQVTATYTVDGTNRVSVGSFSFQVLETLELITFSGVKSTYNVGETLSGQAETNTPDVTFTLDNNFFMVFPNGTLRDQVLNGTVLGINTLIFNADYTIAGITNSFNGTLTFTVTDTAVPFITIIPITTTLEIGDTFTPPIVIASDNDPAYSGTLTNSTTPSIVDTSSLGVFTITYVASIDAAGNIPQQRSAIVNVVDNTAPEITASYTTIILRIGDTFTPPLVTVSDNDPAYSGTITNSTTPSTVDTSSIGNYTITYLTNSDSSGNSPIPVQVSVIVTGCNADEILDSNTNTCVIDTTRPVITVNGSSVNRTITVIMGEAYTLPAGVVTDNDANYTESVTADPSTIETSSVGSFTITYAANPDTAGNLPLPVVLTVNVTAAPDTTRPLITVDGSSENRTVTAIIGEPYTAPAGVVTDDDENYTESVTADTSTIDTSSIGAFTITYTANPDAAGNLPLPVVLTVNVEFAPDTTRPLITVDGSSENRTILVTIGEPYVVPIGVVTDADASYNETVTADPSTIDTSSIQNHTITYTANPDTAGNLPHSVVLTIMVQAVDTTRPVISVESLTITLQVGDTFTPPIITLSDNDPAYNGTISNTTSPGPIDTSRVGTFTITYNATADAAGNAPYTVTATVEIIDTTPPTITVGGSSENRTIIILQDASYSLPSVSFFDNDPAYNELVTVTINGTSFNILNPFDTSVVGIFNLTYSIPADAAGNSPLPIILLVNVIELNTMCQDDQLFDGTICNDPVKHVFTFGSGGTDNGELGGPQGITTDGTHLYISDTENNRAQIFYINGTFVKSFGSQGSGNGEFNKPAGIHTNSTHIFVADADNSRIQILDIDGNYISQFGSLGNAIGEFNVTRGITTNGTHIFVVDSQNHKIQIFDNNSQHVKSFGSLGSGNNQFNTPRGITTNNTHIFIADSQNHRIQIFDINGQYVAQIGNFGFGTSEFSNPSKVFVTSAHIFVLDTDNHRIQVFDHNGQYVTQFGSQGTSDGEFESPRGMTANGTHLFIADTNNHKIQVFKLSSALISCLVNQPVDDTGACYFPEPFEFSGLESMYMPGDSLTGTLDFVNNIIAVNYTITDGALDGITLNNNGTWGSQLLTSDHVGNHIIYVTARYTVDGANRESVKLFSFSVCPEDQLFDGNTCVIIAAKHVLTLGSFGSGDGEFAFPSGITTNDADLYIVDSGNNKIQIWDSNYQFVKKFGSLGSTNGQFSNPQGITTNGTHLFISDTGNNRVQIFDIDGVYVSQFGGAGSTDGSFNAPNGIATNDTHLFIVDRGNSRIQIFDIMGNYVSQFGESGFANGQFNTPSGITTNSTHLFVTDSFNYRIQIFDNNGQHVKSFGSQGSGDGEFGTSIGIFATAAHLFVADSGNHRIQIFDHTGQYVAQFGSQGSANGEFEAPFRISINRTHIFVADTDNGRIQIFELASILQCADGQIGINTDCIFDTAPPVITVNGNSANRTVTIPIGEPYVVPAGVVIDIDPAYNETVMADPSMIDTSSVGNHTITYLANPDASGNTPLPVVLTVNVIIVDIAPPVIRVNGSSENRTITVIAGEAYTLPTGIVTDDYDPLYNETVMAAPSIIDTSNPGIFNVTYTAPADAAGNTPLPVKLVVIVECPANQILFANTCIFDTAPPRITVNPLTIALEIDELFTPPTVVLTDNDPAYNETVTFTTIPGPVDTSVPGSYTTTYDAPVDAADNIPVSVVVTIEVSCPDGQFFNKTICSILTFDHLLSFGSSGNEDGQFRNPQGIATNNTHLYIVDTDNNRIQIFDINGNHVKSFGSVGSGNGQFNSPRDIATNGTYLFVAENNNNRVQIFDVNGNHVKSFGSVGSGNGQFNSPRGIATNGTHLFVAETNGQRIQIFDTNGNYVHKFGSPGSDNGEFASPRDIATNSTHLFVAEHGNNRIQIFDTNGNYAGKIGSQGTGTGEFRGPRGVTTTFTHVFVADSSNHRVQVFDKTGQYIAQFGKSDGGSGTGAGEFNLPRRAIINSTHIFIVDQNNHRIQIFALPPSFLLEACPDDQIRNTANVCVIDTEKPFIAVNPTSITLEIDDTFTPPTTSVMDNDPAYSGTITNTTNPGMVDTSRIGVFTITYDATADAAGNIPLSRIVTVNVTDTTPPMIMVTSASITLEIGDTFTLPAAIVTDNDPDYSGTITDSTSPGPVDTSRIRVFTITYDATADAAGNIPLSRIVTVNVTDTTPPMIMVTSASITLEIGDTFTLPAAIVTDNDPDYSGTITDSTSPGPVDTSSIGVFTITYDATADAAGNIPLSRIVTVNVTDTTPPMIMVTSASITLEIDDTFTPPTVNVTDNDPAYSGTISNSTSPSMVDTSRIGVFTITYDATADAAGNIPLSRIVTVNVTDTTPPKITITPTTITLQVGELFTPPIITLSDNDPSYAGTVSDNNTSIDTSSVGIFFIQYTAPADDSGNEPLSVILTVNVEAAPDTTSPRIMVNPSTITLEIDDTFTPPTVTVSDNDTSYVGIISNTTSPGPIDTSRIGVFTITYNATADASGNAPIPVTVTVNVTDTTPPEIAISTTTITLQVGESFTPPIITLSDNDPDYSESVTANNTSIDTSSVGIFFIQYTALADASGNTPLPVTLTVIVTDCNADQILDADTNTCVTDTTAPMIMVTSTSITLEIDDTFTPPTVNVTDNDPAYSGTISNTTSPGMVDTSRIGVFTITYDATADTAGNIPLSRIVTVNVTDTTPPEIAISTTTITLQVGESFTPPIVTLTDNDPDYSESVTANNTSIDTSSVGIFFIQYTALADASGNEPLSVILTVNVEAAPDTTSPRIMVNPSTITLEIDDTFTPPTVTVSDNDTSYVGIISNTTSPGPIDTSRIGVFTITYNATADASGNAPIPVNVTVNVTDTTPPEIAISTTTITLQIGESFTPPIITLSDNDPDYSESVTANNTSIDTSSVGIFFIQYTALADASGNTPLPVTLTVIVTDCNADQILDADTNTCVTDTTAPMIMVTSTSIILEIDDTFTPPTVNVTDNDPAYSGIISNTTSPGPIDTSRIGVFTITYNATADASGNAPIPVTVTVNVTDTTPPEIAISATTITLQVGELFTPPIITLSDNDPDYSESVTANNTSIDTSSVGIFFIQYTALADASGNTPLPVTLTVIVTDCNADQILDADTNTCVTDTTAPMIMVTSTSIILEIDDTFTPPTVNVTDNDPAYSGIISNTTSPGPIDTSRIGVFTITYNATADAAGNAPIPVTVTVNVTDTTPPEIAISATTITLQVGELFTPPIITLSDNDPDYSESVTANNTSIDTSSVGIFFIQYTALADASGNTPLPVTLTVIVTDCNADQILDADTNTCVTDTTAPMIMVTSTSIILEIDDTFTPPTVNVTDNDPAYSGIISNTTSHGMVDTSRIGVFTITYNATADAAGNIPLSRIVTVNVTDTTPPEIAISTTTITLQVGESFTPPIVTLTDNDPDYSGTVTAIPDPNTIDTSSVRNFTIIYDASADAAGNIPLSKIVTITVIASTSPVEPDTTAPVIRAGGSSENRTIIVQQDESYTLPTPTINDNVPNYNRPVTVTINGTSFNVTNPFDTSTPGTFIVTYDALPDANNNDPIPVILTVNVEAAPDTTSPTIEREGANPQNITLSTAYTELGATCTDEIDGTINPIINSSNVDVTTVGGYTVTYDCADAAGNNATQVTRTVNIIDITPPVITVDGNRVNRTVTVTVGDTYTVLAGNVTDNDPAYIKSVTSNITSIDTSSVATFIIQYMALDDASGNSPIPVLITVNVEAAGTLDTTPPEIRVDPTSITLEIGDTFTPPTVIVTDNVPGYVGIISNTTTPSGANASSVGVFTITYNATADAAGNAPIPVNVTVNVTDTTAPRIMVDLTNITLQIGDTFTPPAVTLSDNDPDYVGTISNSTTPSAVDTSSAGTFTITYTATPDASGNAPDNVTTTVNVIDTTAPMIMVTSTSITLEIGDTFTPPTVTVSDNDPDYVGTILNITNPRPVDTSRVGVFTITYTASTDASNNAPIPVTVTVNVTDITLPVITANSSSITLQLGDTFTPPTVTVSDNDPSYSGSVTAIPDPNTIDTSSIGNYTITYSATPDASGNTPASITVSVIVTGCNANQYLDTNTCEFDTMPPVITVNGASANGTTLSIPVGFDILQINATVTDNNPSYSGTVTFTAVDTTMPGTFTITYSALADAAGNSPLPVEITVTVSCPVGHLFDGNACMPILEHVLSFGNTGSANGQFNAPLGVATNNTHIFIVDTDNHRVQILDINGNYVGQFGSLGFGNGQFNTPDGIAINGTHIFVADTNNNRIQILDFNGNYVTQFGSLGSGYREFNSPAGISINSTHIFIADRGNHRVQIWDNNGIAISEFGSGSDPRGSTADGEFTSPSAIITNDTHLFVVDQDNHRVQIFDDSGNYVAKFGSQGTADAEFSFPTGITTNSTHLFVVDTENHRIQIFDINGVYVSQIGESGTGNGQFNSPRGITTNSTHLFIVDTGNNRLQVFEFASIVPCANNEIRISTGCIIDDAPPLITVSSVQTIFLLDAPYREPTATISDNDPAYSETITITTTPIPVDTSSEGNYTITYTASDDAAGNSPLPVEIIIEVVATCPRDTVEDHFRTCIIDTALPTITIPGPRYVTVLVGGNYTLPNATVSDNAIAYNETTIPTPSIVDTSSVRNYTIIYDGLPDASGNQPLSIVLTVTVATECPTGQTPNSNDVCIVSRTSGGSSSDWKTKPTFGVSWENNQPFISSGFTLNDYTLDITNNWHTSFVPVNGVIGKENNAKIKVYAPKGLNTVILSLGVPEVGKVNDAETDIIVSIQPNYTGTISYIITGINHEQKESLVDETQTTATLSKSLCNDSDIIEKCYTVDINFIVQAPLKSDPIAITAIDTKNRYTTTYINEGLTFTGDSMLEPATVQLVTKKGNQYAAETIDLVQQDRRHNLWEDQHGNLWTQNDHDTWIQLTFTKDTPKDSYVNVMTRMHSAFDSRIDVHTQNMESIRDSMYKDVYTDDDQ